MKPQKINTYNNGKPAILVRLAMRLSKLADSAMLRRLTKYSIIILLFLFATDLHRFGAWWTGTVLHMKPYWFQFVCLLWGIMGLYALSKIMRWLEDREQYQTMHFVLIAPLVWFLQNLIYQTYVVEFGFYSWKPHIVESAWWFIGTEIILPLGVSGGFAFFWELYEEE